MPCFKPLKAYKNPNTGGIQFHSPYSDLDNSFPIPCRQCTGCRTEYARQWAMRLVLEQQAWDNNIFITLTYDNEHLPEHNTLVKKDFQLFMKRLRKKKSATAKNPIRFFHAGEYGEKFGRPHYHAILFNTNFSDREVLQGHKGLTTSKTLDKLWGKGHTSIGDVTFQSASYVAGYIQKKINGSMEKIINPKTGLRPYEIMTANGEIITRQKEYSTMSRNPGIAGLWLPKHHTDIYPSDTIHINGMEMQPPKYFDRVFEHDEITFPGGSDIMEKIKEKRVEKGKQFAHLRTPEALAYLEKIHKAKNALYKRKKL
jgi:hypothetical protein